MPYTRLFFPSWVLPVVFAAIPVMVLLIRVRGALLTRRRRNSCACPACGYDLRASPGRCPECGATAL